MKKGDNPRRAGRIGCLDFCRAWITLSELSVRDDNKIGYLWRMFPPRLMAEKTRK